MNTNTNPMPYGTRTVLSALASGPALLLFCVCCLMSSVLPSRAASFSGSANVKINDFTGGLSWDDNVNALTVQCWFKLSIPSGVNPTENMTILVNRTSGTSSDNHAFHLYYNYANHSIDFSTKGTDNSWSGELIPQPYLDRWYHVAVVRSGNSLSAYVDGQPVDGLPAFNAGDTRSADGVSIGGWGNSQHLYGEVQEVTIYQTALGQDAIQDRQFKDQTQLGGLVGYYKLGYSTNAADHLKNFATSPPTGTDPALAVGQVLFEETDTKGEQSLFDSMVNGGKNAIAPLSGAFVWQQSVLSRSVPGVPFDFSIVYSPSFSAGAMGRGWNYSLNSRVEPVPGLNTWKLFTWQGGVQTWDGDSDLGPFQTRDGEYQGEFVRTATSEIQWTNSNRMVYRYLSQHNTNSLAKGRLAEISDCANHYCCVRWL